MRKLKVHEGKRYLMWDDGQPFFYMGDTAWELFHKLSREEITHYFTTREKQEFNVIQAVCLAELDGIGTPNYYGEKALEYYDKKKIVPNEKYFELIDWALDEAAKHHLVIAMLPTWGDKFNQTFGKGPQLLTPENARSYAKWLAERYSGRENIIWVLGGDRPLENDLHREIIDAMGTTLKKYDKNHLITFHPPGAKTSSDFVAGKEYIDFHMNQSGHDVDTSFFSEEMLDKDFARDDKPALDGESRYEDHPACFNSKQGYFWNDADVRINVYTNILNGACGQTYGNHAVWSMNTNVTDYFTFKWNEVLNHPGAEQFHLAARLRLSRPFFELKAANDLLVGESCAKPTTVAARGKDYAFVYSPLGLPFTVNLAKMGSPRITASWYDVKTGEITVDGVYGPNVTRFAPVKQGKGNDIVLILDNLYL